MGYMWESVYVWEETETKKDVEREDHENDVWIPKCNPTDLKLLMFFNAVQ